MSAPSVPRLLPDLPRVDRPLSTAQGVANPASTCEVASALGTYLMKRLDMISLRYSQEPAEFPDGWETYTYCFQLESSGVLPPEFARLLVLRIYASPEGLPRAQREYAVQGHMQRLGYPVAEPLLLEETSDVFGGPFLLMALVPGQTLLHSLLRRPWRIVHGAIQMAATHVQLHSLAAQDFPSPPGSFLTRHFQEMATLIREYDLSNLKPGLDWLITNRPAQPGKSSIIHLDFHPLNLIYSDGYPLSVLDWVEADVGDPHADVATTMMLMQCVPPRELTFRERLSVGVGRFWLLRWYLKAYRTRRPLDRAKLSYYRAWAALRRLCCYGRWLHGGPLATGSKPTALQHLTPGHLETLQNYFQKFSGVNVSL